MISQDLKCFIGFHKYDTLETIEIKNSYNEIVRKIYVSKCTNCGKIHHKIINYESYR